MDIKALGGIAPASAVARPPRADATPPAEGARATGPKQAEAASEIGARAPQARQPIEEAVSSIKAFAQSIQRNLNFALDDSTGRVVVKVTDAVSGDVIRQIPTEDALRLAESLDEVRSLLFKAEA